MTEPTRRPRSRKPKGPFFDEPIDQLLAQVREKDAESLLCESGLVGQLKKLPLYLCATSGAIHGDMLRG